MRLPKILLFILACGSAAFGQSESHLTFSGFGNLYSEKESPFWIHSNQRGRVDEKTFFNGLINYETIFKITRDQTVEFGLGALYKDGYDPQLKFDEIFFSYDTERFGLVIGKKQREEIFQGLSISNESILWSLNATPLPGIRLYMREPFFITGNHGIGFKLKWEEYLMDDDRYVQNARLHHKSAHLVYRNDRNLEISLGLQQFVQWAGTAPEFGKLPNTFDDYIRVFSGMAGNDDVGGQEVNALGNQLGSYELNVKSKINDIDFHFLYNHIFEDASGLKLGNFPDGRYGIYFEDNRDTFWGKDWLKAFMYEFYFTKNQSRSRKSSEVDGADNYFNNNLYRSGWTYQNFVLGTPLILKNEDRFRIGTNIVVAHHIGIKGTAFENIPYRFLLTYRKNYGRKDSFFAETRQILSSFVEVDLINSDYNLKVFLGADVKNVENSNIGAGVKFSKTIF